jgi:hypothetical protein
MEESKGRKKKRRGGDGAAGKYSALLNATESAQNGDSSDNNKNDSAEEGVRYCAPFCFSYPSLLSWRVAVRREAGRGTRSEKRLQRSFFSFILTTYRCDATQLTSKVLFFFFQIGVFLLLLSTKTTMRC